MIFGGKRIKAQDELGPDDEESANNTTQGSVGIKELWQNKKNLIHPLFIASTAFPLGWDVGTVGGFTSLDSFKMVFGTAVEENGETVYTINPWIIGSIIASLHIGCVIGGLTLGRVSNHSGYKPTIDLSMMCYVMGTLLQFFAVASTESWVMFIIGRSIIGISIGSLCVVGPLYISETSPARFRGVAVSFHQNVCCIAIFIGNVSVFLFEKISQDSNVSLVILLTGQLIIAIIVTITMVGIPESPRFWVKIGHEEQAKRSIAKLKFLSPSDQLVQLEYQELVALIHPINDDQRNEQVSFISLFKARYLKRTISSIAIMALQQLTGINYFFYYGTLLFSSVGLNNPYLTTIILGSVNLISTPFGGLIIESLGRRMCLIAGSILMFICMLIYSSVGIGVISQSGDSPVAGLCMVFFTCLHIIGFSTTWGPCAGVVISEISNSQTLIVALASGVNWSVNFLITLLTPTIAGKIGYGYGYVFAACLFCSAVFIYFIIPETKGLTMEQIDLLYTDTRQNIEVHSDSFVEGSADEKPQDEKLVDIQVESDEHLGAKRTVDNIEPFEAIDANESVSMT